MKKPMFVAVAVGGLVALPMWAKDVNVASGAFSAANVQSGDAVTVTGSCENDIEGLSLQSLTFSGSASCELTGKGLTLGAGGLIAGSDDADATAVTNAIRCRITLSDAQTWAIRGTGRELHLHDSLDTTAAAHALTRIGTGVWRLYADTFGDGDITLDKDDGTTYAYGPNSAFGSAKSKLTIKGQSIRDTSKRGGAKLHLCGTVVSNGVVTFDGYYVRRNSGQRQCWLISDAADRPNVVHGQIVMSDGYNNSLFIANPKGQTLVLDGGCPGDAKTVGVRSLMHLSAFSPDEYNNKNVGTLVVTNGAWKIREDIGFRSQTRGVGTFVFGAPGSTVGGTIYWQGADITFTEDYTLGSADATTGLGRFDGRYSISTQYYEGCPVRFGRTRQRLGGFARDVRSGASFDGEEGSVFFCRQANDVTVAAAVSGELSFVKEGEGRLTFTKASDTTGTLGVTEGALVLTADAAWLNTTNVLVAGEATLSVSNKATFAAKPAVSVADGARLDLAFEGRAKVATLTLGETTYRTGVFGAPGSGAATETEALMGTGRLVVGKQGIALIIR